MALADRIAVMDEGRVEQAAAPRVLYREPATAMVARFVGRGMVVPVEVIGREAARTIVDLWGVRIAVRGEGAPGERRELCLHVEDLALTTPETAVAIRGRVVAVAYQGAVNLLTIQPDAADAPPLKVEHSDDEAMGAAVAVVVRDGWIIPKRST
jgi:iron(III) transport system ATP-binding protein